MKRAIPTVAGVARAIRFGLLLCCVTAPAQKLTACHIPGLRCFVSEEWTADGMTWAILTFHGPRTLDMAAAVARDIHVQRPNLAFYIVDRVPSKEFSQWARNSDDNAPPLEWITAHYFGLANRFMRHQNHHQWALSPGGVIASAGDPRPLGPVE